MPISLKLSGTVWMGGGGEWGEGKGGGGGVGGGGARERSKRKKQKRKQKKKKKMEAVARAKEGEEVGESSDSNDTPTTDGMAVQLFTATTPHAVRQFRERKLFVSGNSSSVVFPGSEYSPMHIMKRVRSD